MGCLKRSQNYCGGKIPFRCLSLSYFGFVDFVFISGCDGHTFFISYLKCIKSGKAMCLSGLPCYERKCASVFSLIILHSVNNMIHLSGLWLWLLSRGCDLSPHQFFSHSYSSLYGTEKPALFLCWVLQVLPSVLHRHGIKAALWHNTFPKNKKKLAEIIVLFPNFLWHTFLFSSVDYQRAKRM